MGLDKIESHWTCDWCQKNQTSYSGERPKNWDQVVLFGTKEASHHVGVKINNYKTTLCYDCKRVYNEALKDLYELTYRFWWSRVRWLARREPPREVDLPWREREAADAVKGLGGS